MKKWIRFSLLLPFIFFMGLIFLLASLGMGSSDVSSSTSGSLSGNASAIYQVLKAVPGATDEGISAVLGNWQIESGLDPNSIESKQAYDESRAMNGSISGYGFGIPQFDSTRRVELLKYAQSQGKSWNDLNLQLDFALNADGKNSTILKEILKETDVTQAATDFDKKWERSSGGALQKRIDAAKQFLSQIQSGTLASTSGGQSLNAIPPGWNVSDPQPNTNFTGDDYPWGQCTWWVWGRAQQLGIQFDMSMGNGGDWWHKPGYTVTQTPTRHAAISFSPGEAGADVTYGHVAFVEDVKSDGSILISESNYNGQLGAIHYRVLSAGEAKQFHYVIGK